MTNRSQVLVSSSCCNRVDFGTHPLLARHQSGGCAVMRRIDLTCLILSPMMVGFAMTYAGTVAAVLVILAWNLAAWAPECMLLTYSEAQVPRLRYVFNTYLCLIT